MPLADSAQAVPRQVPAQISWPGTPIKTRLPIAYFYLWPSVQPGIPYASSYPLLPPASTFCLMQGRVACRDKPEDLQGEKKYPRITGRKTGGERHGGVGMTRKKGVRRKKRNAHCTFQMDGK